MEALSVLVSPVVFAFVREHTVGLPEYDFLSITHSITQKESSRYFKSIYFTGSTYGDKERENAIRLPTWRNIMDRLLFNVWGVESSSTALGQVGLVNT